jgi:hypothetical protein
LTHRDNLEIRSFRCTIHTNTHKIHLATRRVATRKEVRVAVMATVVTATAAAPEASAIGIEDLEDRVSVAAGAGCVAAMCERRF